MQLTFLEAGSRRQRGFSRKLADLGLMVFREDTSRKGCLVSPEIFIFKILGMFHSLSEAVLGENIGFSRRTAESAIFNPGIYGMMQA